MKPGPKPKDESRTAVTVRVPKMQLDHYDAEAARLGLSRGDYVVMCMARQNKLPMPGYITALLKAHRLQESQTDVDQAVREASQTAA